MIPNFGDSGHKTIRIFISSTFSDLQREREVLVRSVFPRLRRDFADRSVEIIDVDLRWGLPEDLSETGKVIEICLGEVLRCRPFFMGILGKRHGYVPNEYEIGRVGGGLENYLDRDDVEGMSITEMEIRTGLNPRFGRTLYSFHMKDKEDDEKRLFDLKTELEAMGGTYYRDIHDFEEQAYSMLHAQIDGECPRMELPYGDPGYPSHLAILNERTARYIRLSSHDGLADLIEGNGYVHIRGDKGSGKTSLMAHLIGEIGVGRDRTVFFHFSGIGEDSMIMDTICDRLRRFMEFHLGPVDITSDSPDSMLKELIGMWPHDRELYLFLDATEKVHTSHNLDLELYELACNNPSLHVVCSSTASVTDREPSASEYHLTSLGSRDKTVLLESYLGRYGKTLSPANVTKLVSNAFIDSPLNLIAVCDLLRVYGDYDTFNSYIGRIVSISDLSELLDAIVENLEGALTGINMDPGAITDILDLVAFSYRGVRERDIGGMLGVNAITRVMVLQAFESFITNVDGHLRVDHDLMLDCMVGRGRPREGAVRSRMIGYHAGSDDVDSHVELAYQYGAVRDFEGLADLVTRREVYRALDSEDHNLLIRSFNHLRSDNDLLVRGLKRDLEITDLPTLCPILVESGCFRTCMEIVPEDLSVLGSSKYAVLNAVARSEYKLGLDGFVRACDTYRGIIDEYRSEFPDDELGPADYILKYAISADSCGRVDEAIRSYEYLNGLYRARGIDNYHSSWVSGNLASCYLAVGRLDDSRPMYEYALDVRRRLYGEKSPEVAWEYCYYWTYLAKIGQISKAKDVSWKAVDVYSRTYGENSVECAWSLVNHANSLTFEESYDEARTIQSRSIELNDSVLPEEQRPHSYSLTSYNNRALIDSLNGSFDEGEFLRIAGYKNDRNGPGHPYCANTYICLGSLVPDAERGVSYYEEALGILEGCSFANGPDSLFVELCIAVRRGSGPECLHDILGRYDPGYADIPDIAFLVDCINGVVEGRHPKVLVSHNNGSELLCFPSELFNRMDRR